MCASSLACELKKHLIAHEVDPLVAEYYSELMERFGVTGARFLTSELEKFLDASFANDTLRAKVYKFRETVTARFDNGTSVRTASGAVGRVVLTTAARTCYVLLDSEGKLVEVPEAELQCAEVLFKGTRVTVRDKGSARVLFVQDGDVGVVLDDWNLDVVVVPRSECASGPPTQPTRTLWRAGAEPPRVDPHAAIGDSVAEQCFVVAFDTDRVVVYDTEAAAHYLLPLGAAEPPPKRARRSSF
jgi:hypothetical protein